MMATGSRGASNAKAKRELGWTLRYPSWRQGFPAAYAALAGADGRNGPARPPLADLRWPAAAATGPGPSDRAGAGGLAGRRPSGGRAGLVAARPIAARP